MYNRPPSSDIRARRSKDICCMQDFHLLRAQRAHPDVQVAGAIRSADDLSNGRSS
jgi:hypothetical protein